MHCVRKVMPTSLFDGFKSGTAGVRRFSGYGGTVCCHSQAHPKTSKTSRMHLEPPKNLHMIVPFTTVYMSEQMGDESGIFSGIQDLASTRDLRRFKNFAEAEKFLSSVKNFG